jgi:hypothetical protein
VSRRNIKVAFLADPEAPEVSEPVQPGRTAGSQDRRRHEGRRAPRRKSRERESLPRRTALDARRIMPRNRSTSLSARARCDSRPDSGQDFGDSESQRVFGAAALAVARELGRRAAHEYFAEQMEQRGSR